MVTGVWLSERDLITSLMPYYLSMSGFKWVIHRLKSNNSPNTSTSDIYVHSLQI